MIIFFSKLSLITMSGWRQFKWSWKYSLHLQNNLAFWYLTGHRAIHWKGDLTKVLQSKTHPGLDIALGNRTTSWNRKWSLRTFIVKIVASSICLRQYVQNDLSYSTVECNQVNRCINRRQAKTGISQQERNKRQLLLRLTSLNVYH